MVIDHDQFVLVTVWIHPTGKTWYKQNNSKTTANMSQKQVKNITIVMEFVIFGSCLGVKVRTAASSVISEEAGQIMHDHIRYATRCPLNLEH